MLAVVLISLVIGLFFNFLNGMNDAANSIATVVATKVLSPMQAVVWAAFWNFAAAFVFQVSVADTMGRGIVAEDCINEFVILSALIGSVFWIWICTKLGLPISASHAMIGGLIGPVWFAFGSEYLVGSGIFIIVLFIVLSPLLGLLMGFLFNCILIAFLRKRNAIRIDKTFMKLQLLSSAAFSLGHGGNDGQKTMGVLAILLASVAGKSEFVANYLYDPTVGFHVPAWLLFTCYGLISLGTVTGGWKVIRTLGDGLSKLTPVQGFCSEISGAITLIVTAVFGIPVSTTHTITGAIIGTGLTRGFASVKWITAKNIVGAWILTIPAVIIISGLIYLLCTLFVPGLR